MPLATHTDFIVATGVPGLWVRLHNNSTGTDYFSTAATDSNGAFTYSAPPGDYSLYVGFAATVPGTQTLRTSHYAVPVTAGDDIAAGSLTTSLVSPYASTAPAGSVGGLYFAPVPIGGGSDDTTVINAFILAVYNAGGGTIVFRGSYRFNGALVIPNSGGVPPTQSFIHLMGLGATWNGTWATPPTGATTFDMRFNGDAGVHVAKIDTRGSGLLEISGIVFTTTGDDFPFIQTTNTTIKGHHNAFLGNRNKTGIARVQ